MKIVATKARMFLEPIQPIFEMPGMVYQDVSWCDGCGEEVGPERNNWKWTAIGPNCAKCGHSIRTVSLRYPIGTIPARLERVEL